MKAVAFEDGSLSTVELPDPTPGEGQILAKVLRCGVCGTDLHFKDHCQHWISLLGKQGYKGLQRTDGPIVLGHEFSAEVLEVRGRAPRGLRQGTPIVAVPLLRNRSDIEMIGLSSNVTGGFAELTVVESSMAMPIPNGLSAEAAALTEPMAVAWHAVKRSEIKRTDVAIVMGCGPVGLAVISMLKARGVKTIIASDFSAVRRHMAAVCGAQEQIDPSTDSPFQQWDDVNYLYTVPQLFELAMSSKERLDRTGLPWWHLWSVGEKLGVGKSRPIVFECVGAPGVLQSIVDQAPQFTRIVVVGVCMQDDCIEPAVALHKELDIRFSLAYTPLDFRQALHMLAEGEVNASALLTGQTGLAGVDSAFDLLRNSSHHAKILIDPSSDEQHVKSIWPHASGTEIDYQ